MTTPPQALISAHPETFQTYVLDALQRTNPAPQSRLRLKHAPISLATSALISHPPAFIAGAGVLATFGYTTEDIPFIRDALLAGVRELCAELPLDQVLPAERCINAAAKDLQNILARAPQAQRGEVVQVERRSRRITIVRIVCDSPTNYTPGQLVYLNPHFAPGHWEVAYPAIPANEAGQLELHIFHEHPGNAGSEEHPDSTGSAESPGSAGTEEQPSDADAAATSPRQPRPAASQAQLARLRPGDTCLISPGQGHPPSLSTTGDPEAAKDLLFISHGTALAPLRAMMLALMNHPTPPRTHMFVAADYPGEQYELGTLWQIAGSCPWLFVTPVVRHQQDAWWVAPTEHSRPPRGLHLPQTGEPGAVVAGYGKWLDRQIVIAGTDAEIQASRQALLDGGTPESTIKWISTSQRYFWEL